MSPSPSVWAVFGRVCGGVAPGFGGKFPFLVGPSRRRQPSSENVSSISK
jgi:hypothetical protein